MELFLQNWKDLRMSSRSSCRHSHRDYSVIVGVFHMEDWTAKINGSLTRHNLFAVDILNIQVQDILPHPRSQQARGCTHSNVHHSLRMSRPSAPDNAVIIFVKLCQFIYLPLFESGGPCFARILTQSDRGFLKKSIRGSNFDLNDALDLHNGISEIIQKWIRL